MFGCSCIAVPSQKQRETEFIKSCFPKTESLINNNPDILKNFVWKTEVWDGEDYNSIIDMIFCNLYPYHKTACIAFYKARGSRLNKKYNTSQINFWDIEIVRFLTSKKEG